jgi:hypothetical protein
MEYHKLPGLPEIQGEWGGVAGGGAGVLGRDSNQVAFPKHVLVRQFQLLNLV